MATLRAHVTFPMDSGVPEDNVVGTFGFQPVDPVVDAHYTKILDEVEQFYTEDVGLGSAIQAFLSPHFANEATLRIYNLADAEPRAPRFTGTFALATAGTPIPSEVACVLTVRANPVAGIPRGRLRGRLFIGPLDQSAVNAAVTPPRPADDFLDTLVGAAERLVTASAGAPATNWGIISFTPAQNFKLITNGWADDEFDTMRSRGGRRTKRVLFP